MKYRTLLGLALALSLVGCGSSSDNKASTVASHGTLSPAPGLSAADFTVWGPADDAPSPVSGDGAWNAQGYPHRTGILFASPRTGSAAAASLGLESGLYMTPIADSACLVKTSGGLVASTDAGAGYVATLDGGAMDGGAVINTTPATSGYTVATAGEAAMDATTTVISMLLMHPSLAHPSSDVSVEQLRWIASRMANGWPCLAQAAMVYDADLLARLDFSADANFTTAFATCLDDVATMPVIAPAVPTGKQNAQAGRTGRLFASSDGPADVSVQSVGVAVSTVKQVSVDNKGVTMEPGTKNGTGLDYYYTVKQVDDSLAKSGTDSPVFASPNQFEIHSTTLSLASGFVPASSYWGYLDVIGNTFKKVTTLISSAVVDAPNRNVTLPSQHMYEVRFYSGGFGVGTTADAYAFATANFQAEHEMALFQNVTMAVVEVIALIPGAGEVLAEGDGGKILQAVVQKTIVDLRALIAAKGGNVTGDDIYNLAYGVCKTAVDSTIITVTSDAQASVGKQFLGWLVGGGKKAIKAVMGLPGKVAKGGTLGNRAFRLANPDSVMEYTIVAVGYTPGNCEPFMNAMAIQYGSYSAECKQCANLACATECNSCGSSCIATEATISSYIIDACEICNNTGMSSKECTAAMQKEMIEVAYTPGAGQPQELAQNTNVCVINACAACNDWYSAKAVCAFPTN
jgi:hypothetical protein